MIQRLALCLTVSLSTVSIYGCGGLKPLGVTAPNSAEDTASADSEAKKENQGIDETKAGNSHRGTLHLIPDAGRSVGGLVNYTVYESGLLVYEGYVTYCAGFWRDCMYKVTEAFSGRYQAEAKSFLSSTYAAFGSRHNDFKLEMEVTETNGDLNVVDIDVRESPAHGRFEVDTSGDLIDVHYAEVKGSMFGTDIVIRAKK